MSQIDVEPTVDVIRKMAEKLRAAALELDAIAIIKNLQADGNFEHVGDAATCIANLMPNMRLDLLVVRPLEEFGAN